ncbi:MAG: hypothetical protein IH944_09255 [Armatimonadetes bacterium]|nr:hypothetical protein [Armatimonadota bacterium]
MSDQLLEQIASQMADLVREVTELRAEVSDLRAAKPVEGADPERQEGSASESESGTWERGFNGASLARDIDVAMSQLDETSGEDNLIDEEEPEDDPIDEEERKRLELEVLESHPDLTDTVAQFNAPLGHSPSVDSEPMPESGDKKNEETEMDDQVQSDSAAMSEDEIQALLAEASAGESKPTDPPAEGAGETAAQGGSETEPLPAQADASESEPVEPPQAEVKASADSGDMTDDEIQALLAGASAESPDKDQPAATEATSDEAPDTADPADCVSADAGAESAPQVAGADEDAGVGEGSVELGFTAFQAGKDIEESQPVEKEEPVAEPPKVPKFPERQSPSMELDPAVIARVPAHLAVGALAVPIRIENDELVCRVVEPFDQEALDLIANALAMRVVPEPAPIDEVVKNLRLAYSAEAAKGARTAVLDAAPGQLQKKRSNKKRRKLSKSKRRAA